MAITNEMRRTETERKMKEVLYAINRLIHADDECAPGGLADVMEDDQIVILWKAKEAIADSLGMS